MFARVVPDTFDVPVRTALDVPAQNARAAIHHLVRGAIDETGQAMRPAELAKMATENVLNGATNHAPQRASTA